MNADCGVVVIGRDVDGVLVSQRAGDGYVNATELCKAAGKLFGDYRRLAATGEFLEELASDMGIPISKLVESRKGQSEGQVRGSGQGTWVHPDVAIHLAQWCSAKFAVMVSRWVRDLLTTGSVNLGESTARQFSEVNDRLDRLENLFEKATVAITGLATVVGGVAEAIKAIAASGHSGGKPVQSYCITDRCKELGLEHPTKKERKYIYDHATKYAEQTFGQSVVTRGQVLYWLDHQVVCLDKAILEVITRRQQKAMRDSAPSLFNRIGDFARN